MEYCNRTRSASNHAPTGYPSLVGNRPVPHVGRVLHARDGAVGATAPTEHVAVRTVIAIHLPRQHARTGGDGRARAVAGHGRVLTTQRAAEPSQVRLDEVTAARDRELQVAAEHAVSYAVLRPRNRAQRVEEATVVAPRLREVHGEPAVGVLEAPVHVSVANRFVAPLVDVDEGLGEHRVGQAHRLRCERHETTTRTRARFWIRACGLSRSPSRCDVARSAAKYVPGSVYVCVAWSRSVGAGLGSIFDKGEAFSAAGILTPQIVMALLGLAILALIPVIYKKIKARSV